MVTQSVLNTPAHHVDLQVSLGTKEKSVLKLVFVLFLPFDLIKAGATQIETFSLKHAGDRVYLLDDLMPLQESSLKQLPA